MLPTRLFRNVGIPPPLRSLITPHPSLPPTISVQLRLRLGILNAYSTRAPPASPSSSSPPSPENTSSGLVTATSQPLAERHEPRLSMTFTCTVTGCSERSTHEFSKRSYERGIVLVQCPKCKNRHLIADHLGWFKDSTEDGKLRTVEDILRARGETTRRGKIGADGLIEYYDS